MTLDRRETNEYEYETPGAPRLRPPRLSLDAHTARPRLAGCGDLLLFTIIAGRRD